MRSVWAHRRLAIMRDRAGLWVAACCMALAGAAQAQSYREPPPSTSLDEVLQIDVLHGSLRRIAQTGVVRLGYRQDAAPFSFVPDGWRRPIGYSIDICKDIVQAMSRRLDLKLVTHWEPVSATDRFDAIVQQRVDIECGITSDTVERRDQVSLSAPVFITGARLLARSDSGVRSLRGIVGKRLGVIGGTTAQASLANWLTEHAIQADTVVFDDYVQGYAALQNDEIDALLADEVLLYALMAADQGSRGYRLVGPWMTYDVYALAFAHGDTQMQSLIGQTLRAMAANRDLENTYMRWFQRRLPDGRRLNLPMSRILRTAFDVLARGG